MSYGKKRSSKTINNVVLLGLVSCFADISSEMVYPIIPLYLTAVLGATPVVVGLIEGLAESVASLLKVFSGYISDRFQKKKAIAFLGYSTGLIYKIALLLASSWSGILVARLIDRFGKGIRTAPRDVMIAESGGKNSLGKSFGTHKMLDMAGSATGILIAFFLVRHVDQIGYKVIFVASILPILIALFIFKFVEEKKAERVIKEREPSWKNIRSLNSNLKLYLCVTFLFTLGNSSNGFLLLRAYDSGFSPSNAVLLYFILFIMQLLLLWLFPVGNYLIGLAGRRF